MDIVLTIVMVLGFCCLVGLLLGLLLGGVMAADHDRRVRVYLADHKRRMRTEGSPGDKP